MKRVMLCTGLLLAVASSAQAADGQSILKQQCAACHDLTGPAAQTLQDAWNRKGPDLFYAGNKYQAAWMTAWLQKPQRIRPAGMFYGTHIKPGAKNDEVDESSLSPHMSLSKADAETVTAELMRLKPHDDLIAKETIEPGTVSKFMGEMAFDKFQGCLACHRIEPDYGGLSGPEVYTAGQRLQPQFIASFIRSPQAWSPKSWMPNKHLSDPAIQTMVRYLDVLGKEAANGK